MKIKIILLILCIILTIVLLLQLTVIPTVTRYRQTEQDKVRAEYTALFFDNDGEGKVVALEELYEGNTFNGYRGTFSLNLRNFINEDITQRDIEYRIGTKNIQYNATDGYYVQGLWGKKYPIKDATVNYDFNIIGEGSYLTENPYHEHTFGTDGKCTDPTCDEVKVPGRTYAKVHSLSTKLTTGTENSHIIEVTRKSSAGVWDSNKDYEEITIVIDIIQPYKDSIVFHITVSPKLIVYSISTVTKMGVDVKRLHIQTASSFKEIIYDGNTPSDGYAPDAFRVALHWEGANFDNSFNKVLIHSESGTPDPKFISRPCLITPSLITTQHTLQMYIPAGADFYIDFYPTSENVQIYALAELKSAATGIYGAYTKYKHDISITDSLVPIKVGNSDKTTADYYLIK